MGYWLIRRSLHLGHYPFVGKKVLGEEKGERMGVPFFWVYEYHKAVSLELLQKNRVNSGATNRTRAGTIVVIGPSLHRLRDSENITWPIIIICTHSEHQ